jgi:PTS system mannose-specific IIA component
MIGIVVVTHSQLGEAVDKLREKVAAGIKKAGREEGVLLLTDMFGGTPSNISYSFLEEGRVEVLSGVNLPILVHALNSRVKMGLSELAASLETFGRKSITLASGILKGNKRNGA